MAISNDITHSPNAMQLTPPSDEETGKMSLCETQELRPELNRYLDASYKLVKQMEERRIKLLAKLESEGYKDSEWFRLLQEELEGVERKVTHGAYRRFEEQIDSWIRCELGDFGELK
ncbi:MAG: hypothetical protein L6R37_007875 [Teloschistes peruensis]|nr:MAG: hypothetical protein L6R37_007875 [Teloschistes peruensis]